MDYRQKKRYVQSWDYPQIQEVHYNNGTEVNLLTPNFRFPLDFFLSGDSEERERKEALLGEFLSLEHAPSLKQPHDYPVERLNL